MIGYRPAHRCGRGVRSLVAAIAVRVGTGERVIAVDVAIRALLYAWGSGGNDVSTSQRPARGAVIEFTVGPHRDGVAGRAGRGRSGKVGLDMVGHVSAIRWGEIPRRLVAAQAIRVGGTQRVVVANMATDAGRSGMGANEIEAGGTMAPGGLPTGSVVAIDALVCGETS